MDIHTLQSVDIHEQRAPCVSGYPTRTLRGVAEDESQPRGQNLTPHRPIRVERELWDPFGEIVGPRNRSKIIRQFIAWYVGKPGAKLPRPPKR